MSKELELFNQCFPQSSYREIQKRYEGPVDNEEGHRKYQDSKSPMNNKVLSYDEIKNTQNRIGWIVPMGYVVIDIDNKLNAKNVYTILVKREVKFMYMKGRNGGHFVFKNPLGIGNGAKYATSIGISVDTRALEKGYIILPENDSDRTWGTITNDLDDVPFFLVPLKKLKIYTDFTALKDGDGRNSKLFEHFMNLKDYAPELSADEKIESIRIINTFIFKEPLPNKELDETLLRDSVVQSLDVPDKPTTKEGIAEDIIKRNMVISVNDELYKFNGKYYESIHDRVIERIIHTEYNSKMVERDRKEIIKFIKLKSWVSPKELNKHWNEIVLRNGILNISDMKLYPHNPLAYNTIYIDRNYNESVKKSAVIEAFFDMISNEYDDKKTLLYEVIGYTLLRTCALEKFFICYGEGSTGKSTYLTLIKNLIGEQNVSYLSLRDLKERFRPIVLFGKLANIGDDISSRPIEESDILKKIISGQNIPAEQKGKDAIEFANYAKLIYTANKLPSFQDRTSGMMRRMMLIEINRKVTNPDPFFMTRILDEDYEYLLLKAVQAIRGVLKRNAFTNVESVNESLRVFRQSQSSVLAFIDEYKLTQDNLDGKSVSMIYSNYKQYCEDNGYKALNQGNFRKEMSDELKINILNTTNGPGTPQQVRFKK